MLVIDTSNFYKLLHPRPTVVIISKCPEGKLNAMAASWVTPVSEEPPTVAFAIDREAFTVECLSYCSELTINIPDSSQVDIVYALGTVSGREVDKIKKFKLRLGQSETTEVPYWSDALGVMECKILKEVDVGEVTLYIAEVRKVRVKEGSFTRWGWDLGRFKPLYHVIGRAFTTPAHRKILARRVE